MPTKYADKIVYRDDSKIAEDRLGLYKLYNQMDSWQGFNYVSDCYRKIDPYETDNEVLAIRYRDFPSLANIFANVATEYWININKLRKLLVSK